MEGYQWRTALGPLPLSVLICLHHRLYGVVMVLHPMGLTTHDPSISVMAQPPICRGDGVLFLDGRDNCLYLFWCLRAGEPIT